VTEPLGRPISHGGPFRTVEHDDLPQQAEEGAILVDRCVGCRGLWFDEGEMTDAIRRMKLASTPHAPAQLKIASGQIEDCPRCGAPMEAVQSQTLPTVEYDRCIRCRGIWFDAGEADQFGEEHAGLLALMMHEFG